MLDGLRQSVASGLAFMALRIAREPRDPDEGRIAQGARTLAGVAITPDTAVTVSAVWACLRYLSQTVAVLPWHAMLDGPRGPEVRSSNPVDYLIYKRPNPEWSSFQFRETLTHWALRWGNGYAEIERDVTGRPLALWPIHPERVEVCRDPDSGQLFYEVNNGAITVEVPVADMFHIRGFGEGPVGVNVIQYAAQSLGWAKAAQLFGASFFGNGANVAGVVSMKKGLKPGGMAKMRAELDQLYKGPRNANKTAIIDEDATWQKIGLDAEETQLVEVHQYLIEEICRWFGVPPHKVMHLLRATFSNIEHQAIEVVVDSVSPWVKRFEDEADFKLFGTNRRGLYTKMNMRALMRGDQKTRGEYYKMMREIGAYNVNKILTLEDENTIGPIGEKYTMQQGYTTLERIGEEPDVTPEPVIPQDGETEPDATALAVMADVMAMLHLETADV